MSLEGQQVGEFEILERLGQGGMGAVYKARQTSLGRWVALKTLQAGLADDSEYIERFRQEARAAAVLMHPNLVQVFSAGESDGLYWFAMEYVEGESAKMRLKRKGRIDPLEAIAIAIHVATALEYGWRKASLIHRDIKPDNIFLSQDGEVKLGDLGLAKSAGQTTGLTMTGHSMGTPHYISPEQVEAMKTVDLRADIYSLGCTLYHMLSGQVPFDGNSAVSIMMKHVTGAVPKLTAAWPECPQVLNDAVERMMQKDPAQRQQDHAEVISDLRRAYEVASNPPEVDEAAPERKPAAQAAPVATAKPRVVATAQSTVEKKSRLPLYAGIAVVALAIAAMCFFIFKPKEHAPDSVRDKGNKSSGVDSSQDAKAEGFRPLFNSSTLTGWRSFDHNALPQGWSVADGAMLAKGNRSWIVTEDTFEDFDLRLEWKVGKNGNGGIAFRIPAENGNLLDAPEFQLCARDVSDKYQTGSLYGVLVQPVDASLPTGQWNSARLVVRGGLVEQWVNDRSILRYEMESARWEEQWHAGQFGNRPSYARARKGRIGLQGWTGDVAYRNVRIKALSSSGTASLEGATTDSPFVNNLGMKFVPVPIVGGATGGQRILFSVWDTRVQDYEVFAKETKREWPKPDFEQGATHPAVNVSWTDAQLFCQWLTGREQAANRLSPGWGCRLPSDREWSCAVGIAEIEDAAKLPSEQIGGAKDVFPWGNQWPPPKDAGNYAGEEITGKYPSIHQVIAGYNDGFVNTSPVGSFPPNQYGLYDMGGNVWQWCEDWFDKERKQRELRGASWDNGQRELMMSSSRWRSSPDDRYKSFYSYSFRCVLARITANTAPIASPENKTKDSPFVNSLGMKFVPVPGTKVLFSIWDTRVQDYKVYASANKVDDSWMKQEKDGVSVSRDPDYPVVGVSWEDVQRFNQWLTNQEITGGKLPKGAKYRLPTDEEWSVAVGLPHELGATPAEKHQKNTVDFPWAKDYPPRGNAGNYADESFHAQFPLNENASTADNKNRWIAIYTDGYAAASPVGAFPANAFGLCDMGGNVWQWCEDWFDASHEERVLRGGSWRYADRSNLLSSSRHHLVPGNRYSDYGFRCVLELPVK